MGQAAAWLTVAVMASITTLGVMAIAVGPNLRAMLEGRPLLAIVACVVGLAPWWSLAAVLVQQSRSTNGGA